MTGAYFCLWCFVVWHAAKLHLHARGNSVPVTQEIVGVLDTMDLYDKQATPNQNDGYPTNLSISMYIEGISSFRAQTMDFHLDVYFQQRWKDKRLKHNENRRILIRDLAILHKMWHPDVYFANARIAEFHSVTQPNFLLWLEPDGSIMYDTRISLSVMCMMHLAKWPLDSQNCSLRILSYAYDTDQLQISWDKVDPISRNKFIKMPDMHLLGVLPGTCDGNFPTGIWSCVTARFLVKREIMHHITQSYIPTGLIVVISWFSFWLDVDAVPARVSLSITTLLTLSTQANAARMALPEVSYMKAIDVWMGMCMAFVFGVMIEFTVANYAQRQGEKAALRKDRCDAIDNEQGGGASGDVGDSAGGPLKKFNRTRANELLSPAERTRQREQRALEVVRRAIRNRRQRSNNACNPEVKVSTTTPPSERSSLVTFTKPEEGMPNGIDAALSPLTHMKCAGGSPRNVIQTNALDGGVMNSVAPSTDGTSVAISHGVLRSSLTQRGAYASTSAERLAQWGGGKASTVSDPTPPPVTNLFRMSIGGGGGWNKLKSALGSVDSEAAGGVEGATDPSSDATPHRPSLRRKSMGPDKWMTIIRQANTNKKLFGRRAAKRIDHHARWSFPFCFVVLNILYWWYYLYIAKNVD